MMDLKIAIRALVGSRGVALVSLLTLALGIGATTAVFSVVDGVLLGPLPFPESEALVELHDLDERTGGLGMVTPPNVRDWRAENESFKDVALFLLREANVAVDEHPEVAPVRLASPSLFPVLGVAPYLGRGFAPEEDAPGRDDVVAIGFGFWRARLGGDPSVLGERITIDGRPRTIVGVMPSGFGFPTPDTALWVPTGFSPEDESDRGAHWMRAIARLKPGVPLERAQSEMRAIADRLEAAHPETNTGWSVLVRPLRESVAE